jgi:hypothetical protein
LEIGGFWFELLVFSMLFFLFQAPIFKVGFQVVILVHEIVDFAFNLILFYLLSTNSLLQMIENISQMLWAPSQTILGQLWLYLHFELRYI